MDVDRVAQELTIQQLRNWQGYFLNEPFGGDWQRTARLAAWVAAAMGAKIDEESEDKFLPTWKKRPQTDAEIEAELAKIPWAKRSGGNGSSHR
jgi:hypothetical protein